MWPHPQVTADQVTFTEEIFNGNLHFSCSAFTKAWKREYITVFVLLTVQFLVSAHSILRNKTNAFKTKHSSPMSAQLVDAKMR